MAELTDNPRRADYPIAQIFLDRWSPRAFTGEAIPVETLMSFFEAARWAPSSSNLQPWRFLWARRDTPHWPRFFQLLSVGNQVWAAKTSALIVLVSKTTMVRRGESEPVASYTHSFDAGAAWENFALQATISGWHAHGIGGFDRERAREVLNVPDDHRVEAAIAVGRRASQAAAQDGRQPERPNGRKPLAEITHEGGFPGEVPGASLVPGGG